jgi:hypothetical protein
MWLIKWCLYVLKRRIRITKLWGEPWRLQKRVYIDYVVSRSVMSDPRERLLKSK